MNIAFKSLILVLASFAVLLTGCTKKPARPDPRATVLGPGPGGAATSGINPMDVYTDTPEGLELRGDPNNNILEDENTIRGLLQPVFFDFDRSTIREGERAKLQAASEYLQQNPQHRLLLEGHADWRGTAEYNLGLGDRRANAARTYLTSIGVGADRLETLSKGSLEATQGGDDASMAQDRRVELVILKR